MSSSRAASSSEVSRHHVSGALATVDDGDDDTGDDTNDGDIPDSKQSDVQVLWGGGDILSEYHAVWGR